MEEYVGKRPSLSPQCSSTVQTDVFFVTWQMSMSENNIRPAHSFEKETVRDHLKMKENAFLFIPNLIGEYFKVSLMFTEHILS